MTRGGKRLARKHTVRDWLLKHGPATLSTISKHTMMSHAAVSHALADIRNDPTMEYATVATANGDYKYQIAFTVDHMRDGMLNQAKHMLTRAESAITAGEKMTKIAQTPDEFALAADIKANG